MVVSARKCFKSRINTCGFPFWISISEELGRGAFTFFSLMKTFYVRPYPLRSNSDKAPPPAGGLTPAQFAPISLTRVLHAAAPHVLIHDEL